MRDLLSVTTLSELVELAVADARALDREQYEPKSENWHTPRDGVCLVCLAGAVIAGQKLFPPHRHTSPFGIAVAGWAAAPCGADADSVPGEYRQAHCRPVEQLLLALEDVRKGEYRQALCRVSLGVGDRRFSPLRTFPADVQRVLNRLGPPRHGVFLGWAEFERFLDDLEQRVIPGLRAAGC